MSFLIDYVMSLTVYAINLAVNFTLVIIDFVFDIINSWVRNSKAKKVEVALKILSSSPGEVARRIEHISEALNKTSMSLLNDVDDENTEIMNEEVTDIEKITEILRELIDDLKLEDIEAAIKTYTQTSLQFQVRSMIDEINESEQFLENFINISLPKIKEKRSSEIIDRIERVMPLFLEAALAGKTFFQRSLGIHEWKQEVVVGDRISISGNQGTIVNIKSKLEKVEQSINTSCNHDISDKIELKALIEELFELINRLPSDYADKADILVKRIETATEEASKPRPDKEVVLFSLDSLKKAAANLATVIPDILPLATRIADHIMKGLE